MSAVRIVRLAALLALHAAVASAQFEESPADGGPPPGKAFTSRYQVGVKIDARTACQGIVATFSVPTNWPEQSVAVAAEQISPAAKVSHRTLAGDVEQVLVSIPTLPAGQSAQVLITYEITRRTLPPPEMPEELVLAKKLTPAERRHLGNSPYIEARHPQVRAKVKEILKGRADDPAYKQVEAIYDWVRENIQGREGKLQGAAAALRSGHGQIEDLTSLFIALCRAADVPARTVWVPEGCYAEFLLADAGGKAHWLPCHLTGPRQFGQSDCEFPILQKGDNIRVPEEKQAVRFVPEFLKGAGGRPEVEFIRQPLPAE